MNKVNNAESVAPVTPSEPTYSPETREWTGTCPCILAEQVDPECEWHGMPEFRRGGALHSDTAQPTEPSQELVAKAARVLHMSSCCNLSDEAEHQEPQNEDILTAGIVLSSVSLVAPVTPSESDWLLLLMPDSGAHRTREWRGRAVDADTAIEWAMDENPGWSVHTFGPDVNAKPAPSPDREKLAEWWASPYTSTNLNPGEFADAVLGLFAVPSVVDQAKLAAVLRTAAIEYADMMRNWTAEEGEPETPSAFSARRAVERRNEWLEKAE